MAEWGRRLDKIQGGLGTRRDRYAPNYAVSVILTSRWRPDSASLDDETGGAEEELRAAARQATYDQICSWCADDARRHGYRRPYALIITFYDETQPQVARFHVPWRTTDGPRIAWEGGLHWPDVGADDGDLPPAS